MFPPSRHLPSLGLAAIGMLASAAKAHDAAPQTPAPRTRLAIVQTGQEFSIQTSRTTAPRPVQAEVPVASKLALGFNLKFDRNLFDKAARPAMEASDAPRR